MRRGVIPYLTKIAHGSSPFITTFLLIHLAPPALANLGGSSLSSQTMLLGREYYQTNFGEKYLVFAPIAIHALSAFMKRVLSGPKNPPRPAWSVLTITGYATMWLLLPVHFLVHRRFPTSSTAPILEVGPSELDFEFVKVGLRAWPWRSALLYGGLVVCVVLHVADGVGVMWNVYLAGGSWGRRMKRSVRRYRRAGLVVGVALPVLSGLVVLVREPIFAFASTVKRFEAVFLMSWVYRL
ncbi:uncharacterized protein BT62DRAFT_880411 [Guyanagaster necrorhizus]|uniref:Mitochondrial adapter protein MCP1 transmembrane domain-containing protein n=1 Tax=Guyanagaster necrorhizus TaxID=856835 RepID=A0A9P7W6L9_9AGAR|nr:uncharacterized protein BT62DRAFT_880411 [Guyanagaster necrorhizus MCA 3950]KAG7453132.1 hypothetical protein BT62DRAFT_880411 [Guyanagaster necrorhizus MCA 3950]